MQGDNAQIAQLVEHVLGKDEVTGSIPVLGYTKEVAIAAGGTRHFHLSTLEA